MPWHFFWGCTNNSRLVDVPQDELQQQLGFPLAEGSDNYERPALEHMVGTRSTMTTPTGVADDWMEADIVIHICRASACGNDTNLG